MTMAHMDPDTCQLDVDRFRQVEPDWVGVAAHGVHRSDVLESCHDFRCANVTRVQDHVDTRECPERFGSNQSVSVRNEADQHDFNIVSSRLSTGAKRPGPSHRIAEVSGPALAHEGLYPGSHAPAVVC